jgi:hypothetical protein
MSDLIVGWNIITLELVESMGVGDVLMVIVPIADLIVWHAAEDTAVDLGIVFSHGMPGVVEEGVMDRIGHAITVDHGPMKIVHEGVASWKRISGVGFEEGRPANIGIILSW